MYNKKDGASIPFPAIKEEGEIEALYNADNILPEILIIGYQRSGTHLLESFLKNHPLINGRGEIFLKYEQNGRIEKNKESKINVGILMYGQMSAFEKLGGILKKHKIIHLVRNSEDVALSLLQAEADKKIQGSDYKAHYKENEIMPEHYKIKYRKALLLIIKKRIYAKQRKYSEELSKSGCLELTYESIAPNNKTVKELDKNLTKMIFDYLEIKIDGACKLQTRYIKTGINN